MDTLGAQEDERGCQAACQVSVGSQGGPGPLPSLVLLAVGSCPVVVPVKPSL